MDLLGRFLFYNLLAAMLAGLSVWLLVSAALRIFRVEYGTLRLSLLAAPLIKSLQVLFGSGLVLPWPGNFFLHWHAQALPFWTVLPIVLVWAAIVLLARGVLVRQARRKVLENTRPAGDGCPRLVASMDRVHAAYRSCPKQLVGAGNIASCANVKLGRPELLVSENGLRSPTILTHANPPVIIFPLELVDHLADDELDSALAHEYAHFLLRSHCGVSSTNLRRILPVNPVAGLVATTLAREEEKACDDMAVAALGKPGAFAEMLAKSYRFALVQAGPLGGHLHIMPRLVGMRPAITERVERQLRSRLPQAGIGTQTALTCALWIGLIFLFQM